MAVLRAALILPVLPVEVVEPVAAQVSPVLQKAQAVEDMRCVQ